MFFKNTYPAFLWAALILAFTLSPAPDIEKSWINIPYADKIVHVVLFGVLCFLLMRGLTKQYGYDFYSRTVMWSIITVIFYGAVIEILQNILPTGRSGNWIDWFADCAGAGIGYFVYGRWNKQRSAA